MLGLKPFRTAKQILHILKKGQPNKGKPVQDEIGFIHKLFGVES